MTSLYLSDLFKRNGIDPKRTKLIRHSLNDAQFKRCYNNGFYETYQKLQSENFFKNCDHILAFISGQGMSAKFLGCYSVGSGQLATVELVSEDFPAREMLDEDIFYFDLELTNQFEDLRGRMIIDWGKSAISWHQWATNEKLVLAIQENPKFAFTGYENIVLTFGELKEIVKDSTLYENWHTALSSVYAIYLVTDRVSGKQYVGSAYGGGGLLNRWKVCVDTKHGHNKGIVEELNVSPEQYHHFQFSILQIIPKTMTDDEVIALENLHKKKLMSREFGMNEN